MILYPLARNRNLIVEAHCLPVVALAKLHGTKMLLDTDWMFDVVRDYNIHHRLWQSGLTMIRAVMIQYLVLMISCGNLMFSWF